MPTNDTDQLGLEGLLEHAARDALASALRSPWADRIFTASADPSFLDPDEIGTPSIVVMVRKEEADPPKTNMWRSTLQIDVRASLHETQREEVSAVIRTIEATIECTLETDLTTDLLHCADVEYDSAWERDVDGPLLTHRLTASVWAFKK